MEKDFNPIRDLRSPEVDPFNVPAGQSTQEIEAIRLTLVVTREKTENLVKLLKRKGLLFKQDVEKIKELQRRLRKTIPRIPILRDDSITGTESSMDVSRRSGFDIRGFNRGQKPPVQDPVPVDKPSFPFLDVAISAVLIYFGVRGGGGPNKIKNFFNRFGKNKTKVPTVGDELAEEIARRIKEFQDKGKKVPSFLLKIQKDLNLQLQKQTQVERMSKAFDKNRKKILSGQKFANNKKMFEKELKNLEKGIPEYKIMEFLNKNNIASPTLLKTKLNQAYESDLQKLFKLQKDGKISPGQYADEYLSLQTRYEKFLLEIEVYTKDVEDIVGKYLKSNLYKKYKQPVPKSLEQSNKEINEFIKQNFSPDSPLYNFQKGKSKVQLDGKPMSNDIAMLNTDTRDRETIVIITDSIA